MNIILAIPYNPLEEVGGLEIGTLFYAKTLLSSGHQVLIVSKGKSGNMNGVPVIGFTDFSRLCLYLINNEKNYDVLHWMEIFPEKGEVEIQGMTSGILRALGKTIVLMVATSGNMKNRGAGHLSTPLLKETVDAYVISNPMQFNEFAEVGIVDQVYMIGFGIDTNLFKPVNESQKISLRQELKLPEKKTICLFIGRFVERKRPEFLLEAWKQLDDLYSESLLVVVGSGMNQHDSNEEKVNMLASSVKNIEFREITNHPEKYYQASDILLLPSEREGQPNVLMEMMACGNSVIGSDIPGIAEILRNNINGLTFSVDDMESFKDKIREMVSDSVKRKEFGERARELIVKTKDTKIVKDQYISLYCEIKNRKEKERC